MKKAFICSLIVVGMLATMSAWAGGGAETGASTRTASAAGTTATSIPPQKYHEAPMLAALVAQGKLPPVDQRLPENPMVMPTINKIGKYGGQLRTYNNDLVPRGMWGTSLLRVARNGVDIKPNLASSYSVNADKTIITLHLRPGMKWSDGQPFTSEDIRFEYDDMQNYKPAGEITTWHATGQIQSTKVIDKYTIELICPGGVGTTVMSLASWNGSQSNAYTAAHYLKKFDINYNPNANKLAKEEGYDSWYAAFNAHAIWYGSNLDLKLPKMTPWYPIKQTTTTELHTRNPYYFAVDEAGNQLPYIDTAVVQIVNPQVYQLKVTSGAADIAWSGLTFANISLYKSNAASGNYNVILQPGVLGSTVVLMPAVNYYDKSQRALWQNVKFREALSVAVDRNDINNTLYDGLGTVRQTSPLPSTSYYDPKWASFAAQYDPALANKLLDEVGLSKRDAKGYRELPDGKTLSIVIQYYTQTDTPTLELVMAYWQKVGLKATIKFGDPGLIESKMDQNELQITPKYPNQPPSSELAAFEGAWVWGTMNGTYEWDTWLGSLQAYLTKGKPANYVLPTNWRFTKVPADVSKNFKGVEPPDGYKQVHTYQDEWQNTKIGSPEYESIAKKMFDYYVFNLMNIGFVGMVPSPMIVSNRIGNAIPAGWVKGMGIGDSEYMSQWTDQLYIK